MCIVRKVITNVIDEVTSAELLKGATREVVMRYSTSLIPLLSKNKYLKFTTDVPASESVLESAEQVESRRRRATAVRREKKLKSLISKDLV